MKVNETHIYITIVGLILIGGLYFGVISIPGLDIETGELPTGKKTVTRVIQFYVPDIWGGAAVQSATVKVYNGITLKESLTTSSTAGSEGKVTTGQVYTSGDVLNIMVLKSNSKKWYSVIVPQMTEVDASAVSFNQISLEFFDIDTSVTVKVQDGLGNSYSTTDSLNFTALGVNQVTLTVSGFVSADGKGYASSYDPLNNINWYGMSYGKLSGTGYELMSLTGWSTSYPKGTSIYGARRIQDLDLVKYKSGNDYIYDGTFSYTLTLTKGGYTADTADIDIYLYAYSDPNYHESYGSFGPDSVAMASVFNLNIVN